MIELAQCYAIGDGRTKSIAKAVELYERAITRGSGVATYHLGYYLNRNATDDASRRRGFHLLAEACKDRNLHACAYTGIAYAAGRGVDRDTVPPSRS